MALKAACDYANKERVLACVQQIHHEFTALKLPIRALRLRR
jgi:4-hydroxythreonine-4-phosphate dehydrogenase